MNDIHRLELLLRRIYDALDEYFHPVCNKCNVKETKRTCGCGSDKMES